MIRSISLENFKSWKSVKDMRFAPITGLFGANSSGKTSILQSILLFKQTVDSTDRAQVLNLGDERSPISLGTFKDIIWNHHVNSELFWSVTWDGFRAEMYDPRSHDAKVLFSDDTCTFRCRLQDVEAEWETIFDAIRVAEFTYIFSGAQFTYQYNKQLEAYDLKVDDPKGFDFERRYPGLHGFAEPHRFYGFPTELHKYIKHTEPLSLLEHYIEEYLFRDLYYLGPLRDHPRSGYYLWGGSGGTGVGWRGEKTIDVMIASSMSG